MRILLIEDEREIAEFITSGLRKERFAVDRASTGEEGLGWAKVNDYDAGIFDVRLPGISCFEVCRAIRERKKEFPIIMLSVMNDAVTKVEALNAGADDYLTKPFEPPELLARIEALLRRVNKEKLTPVARFQFGNVDVDFEKGDVRKDGMPVGLAAKELELLRYLIDHRGKVVSRDELLEGVWEYQPGVSSRTIDVHVAWLRQKLEDNPQTPRHIHTVRGVGYRFSA